MPAVTKVWNGSQWIYPYFLYPKVWDGSQWVIGAPHIGFNNGWDGSSTDSHTVTVGAYDASYTTRKYLAKTTRTITVHLTYYGYESITPTFGSIDSSSTALYLNGQIQSLFCAVGSTSFTVYFSVNNPIRASAQWNNLNINGTNYLRSAASLNIVGNQYNYSWSSSNNPFGTSGTVNAVWS